MPLVAVIALVLLLIAALGQSWWWRGTQPGNPWYGNALFYWGVFFFALYVEWPEIMKLLHGG